MPAQDQESYDAEIARKLQEEELLVSWRWRQGRLLQREPGDRGPHLESRR